MENKKIIDALAKTVDLMQLHQQNPFQIRVYEQAITQIQQFGQPLANLDSKMLAGLVGQSMSQKIAQILAIGTHQQLQLWLDQTPNSVIELLKIDGLGPKKAYLLWKEHQIDSPIALLEACTQNRLTSIKGFAQKTQAQLLASCLFWQQNQGKLRLDQALVLAQKCVDILATLPVCVRISITGSLSRYCPIIDQTELLVASNLLTEAAQAVCQALEPLLKLTPQDPWTLSGQTAENHVIYVHLCSPESYQSKKLLHGAANEHLQKILPNGQTFKYWIKKNLSLSSDAEFYQHAGLPYIIAPARENAEIFDRALGQKSEPIIDFKAIKGALHNHTNWSDGQNTIAQMAESCIKMGLEYLGMADHSVSAFYANGLDTGRLEAQMAEIDALNTVLAPFRIFKGVESDILADGSLDYSAEILSQLDYVVASVHSGLKMESDQATQRLIRAIENRYTTILGHPTGRLLLKRQGYQPNISKVLDACAANGVVIELNANPYRLDLDYRFLGQAIDKGVLIGINPDAHSLDGLYDMQYGVWAAQKALIPERMILNSFSVEKIKALFEQKKSGSYNK